MLAMLALLAYAMVAPALQALDYGDRKLELGLPLWVVWAGAMAGDGRIGPGGAGRRYPGSAGHGCGGK